MAVNVAWAAVGPGPGTSPLGCTIVVRGLELGILRIILAGMATVAEDRVNDVGHDRVIRGTHITGTGRVIIKRIVREVAKLRLICAIAIGLG
jgi:hypothetical protein